MGPGPVPPEPGPAPTPQMASVTDQDIATVLLEVGEGLEPWLAFRRLLEPSDAPQQEEDLEWDAFAGTFVITWPDGSESVLSEGEVVHYYTEDGADAEEVAQLLKEMKEGPRTDPPPRDYAEIAKNLILNKLDEKDEEKGSWTGTFAEFNSKLQALAMDELGIEEDLGKVVAALQDGGAMTVKGEEIVLDLPKMKKVLVDLKEEPEPEEDVLPVSLAKDIGTEPVDAGGPGLDLPPPEDIGEEPLEPILPPEENPEGAGPDWEEQVEDALRKFF